ncbi:MAG TPA: prephenate dehydrogenase/arogenate dehydrogenase family protein [Gemmataceae bacterium]|nr:prephenate dehydrogenase/arogenate dehydrogenase family protein [Gemmataceae bacterium]
MQFEQITIVGVGLIGGSVGLAAKTRRVARRVIGFGRDQANLDKATHLGLLDGFCVDLADAVRAASLVVFCTPVDRIVEQVLSVKAEYRPGAILTDAGSTKGNIVRRLDRQLREEVHFVGSHPLAGSEKKGPDHARVDLFENRVTVVTPTVSTDPTACQAVKDFWTALGSRVVTMTPEDHDDALGITSHLPHAVAATLAGITPVDLLGLTAGGFRDTTRIAGGDPNLWAAIFQANRDAVLGAVAQFTGRLGEFRRLLEAGDGAGLVRWLSEAKQVRDALGT